MNVICNVVDNVIDKDLLEFTAISDSGEIVGNMLVTSRIYENVIESIHVEKASDYEEIVNLLIDTLVNNNDIFQRVPTVMTFAEEEYTHIGKVLDKREDCMLFNIGTRLLVQCKELLNNPAVQNYLSKNKSVKHVTSFNELTNIQIGKILQELTKRDINPVESLSEFINQYADSPSLFLMKEDEVEGCLLISKESDDQMTVDAVYFNTVSPEVIEVFIRAAREALDKNPDMWFRTLAINQSSEALSRKLFAHTNNKLCQTVYEARFQI